jgi:uncharacterized protein YjbI with pentapeptide repeats
MIHTLFEWGWTGFTGKTLWDWLQLLIIPVFLAIGGAWFTRKQTQESDAENKDNQRETALQSYLDNMSELLLHEKLRSSIENYLEQKQVQKIARVRTLTVLPRLDGARKKYILQFLYEAGLIGDSDEQEDGVQDNPLVNLQGADFSGVNLNFTNLQGAKLLGVYLEETSFMSAKLSGANLSEANLGEANLFSADLSGTNLTKADFGEARFNKHKEGNADFIRAIFRTFLRKRNFIEGLLLIVFGALPLASLWLLIFLSKKRRSSGASLAGANLTGANLTGAVLFTTNLTNADLTDADLTNADLYLATVTPEQLEQAKTLKGAIMPNGRKHS